MKDRHNMLESGVGKVFERDLAELRPASVPASEWRGMTEGARCAAILSAGTVPAACGPEHPVAPARGAFEVFRPIEITRTADGSAGAFQDAGYRGVGEWRPRRALRRADVFDAMIEEARSRHDASRCEREFVSPFTIGQVMAGRDYRDLVQWRASYGLVSAKAEAGRSGKSSGSGVDSFVASGQRLKQIEASIGAGYVLQPRYAMDRSNSRRTITVRYLVDQVCLWDKRLSQVLSSAGWAAKGDLRKQLRQALVEALERMRNLTPAESSLRPLD